MNICIIGIGSNIKAKENISHALQLLSIDLKIIQVSEMVQTKPIGISSQNNFTNGAIKIETNWTQDELNSYLKKTEDQMGRDRSQPKYGPRCIDFDILIWNDKIMDQDYYTRDFLRQSATELGFNPS